MNTLLFILIIKVLSCAIVARIGFDLLLFFYERMERRFKKRCQKSFDKNDFGIHIHSMTPKNTKLNKWSINSK